MSKRILPIFLLILLSCGLVWSARFALGGGTIRFGQDLLAPYAAGQLVRKGPATSMYDRGAVSAAEQRVMDRAGVAGDARFLPWINPPFVALPFAALAILDYRSAAAVWLMSNILLFGLSLMLLRKMLPAEISPSKRMAFFLAVGLSMPFLQAMLAQQNTMVSLFLLCLVCRCWLSGRGFLAGVCAGLMLFKPQLALVIAAVLGISLGVEAIAGFCLVAVGLLDITIIALPGALAAYWHQLPGTVHWLQMELPYNWGRQATLQGFWRLFIQGHAVGETVTAAKVLTWCGAVAIGIPLAIAAWRLRGGDEPARRRLIAAAIIATPMIAPYYMDYDLLLLAVAAALSLANRAPNTQREASGSAAGFFPGRRDKSMKPPRSGALTERAIPLGWIAMAIAMYVNPFVAGAGRWNVAVIAIMAMAVLLLRNVFEHLPRSTAVDRLCPAAPASALSR